MANVRSVQLNAYATSRTEDQFSTPAYAEQEFERYAAPSAGAPYSPAGTPYAPTLEYSVDSTPDPTRVGRQDITDARQSPSAPKAWWRRLAIDDDTRESVQHVTEQFPIQQETSQPVAPRPTGIGTPLRWTSGLSGLTYAFTRPFTGRIPKRLNGIHFSMADHRRYENVIYGMIPPRSPRGTYRLDTAQWGEEIVDKATPSDYVIDNTVNVPVVPSAQRSYRLGSDT